MRKLNPEILCELSMLHWFKFDNARIKVLDLVNFRHRYCSKVLITFLLRLTSLIILHFVCHTYFLVQLHQMWRPEGMLSLINELIHKVEGH